MKGKKVKITYPDGAYYIGEVKDGKKHGKGTCVYPFGTYTGTFVDDCVEGFGEFRYNDGTYYKGFYKQCQRDFQGECRGKDFKYVGQYKDDKMNGKGTIHWNSGDVYEGGFENDTLHGYGKLTYKNGTILKGMFDHNGMPREGKLDFPDGTYYDGELMGLTMHGRGCLCGRSEYPMEGYFENGVFSHPAGMTKEQFDVLRKKSEASGLSIAYSLGILVFPKNYKPKDLFCKECRKLLKAYRSSETKLPPLYGILTLKDYAATVDDEKKKKEAIYLVAKYYIAYSSCAANWKPYADYAKAEIKKLESFNDKSLKKKILYLEKALEILDKIQRNERTDQARTFISSLMVDASVQSLGREKVTYDDYDYDYGSSSSFSSSESDEEEEYEEVKTTYINFRYGKKGVVVDDDSLSSYKGQLVVDEYTKEPTGLRYKDNHLYDEDGKDLGSFSDLGNFYPNH